MRVFGAYLFIELKRAWKILQKSIGSFLLLMVMIGFMVVLFSITMHHAQVFQKVKIGISIPEDEVISKVATQYISSMDSVSSICEFEYLQEEAAIEQLKKGDLQAVVVLPEGFFHDVQVGINPPAQIYFPQKAQENTRIFEELLSSGVSLLQTAESGVYATLSTASFYGAQMSTEDIGNTIAFLFANQMLEREKMFQEEIYSPLGDVQVFTYYYIAGLVLLLMMCGIQFGFLYERTHKSVEDRLRIYGLGSAAQTMIKILVMWFYLYVVAAIFYFLGTVLLKRLGNYELELQTTGWMGLLLLCLGIAVYFHVIYSIMGDGNQTPVFLFGINAITALGTGMLLPEEYLPSFMVSIGKMLPMRYWNQFCKEIMTNRFCPGTGEKLLVFIIAGIMIGAFFLWKNSRDFIDYN